ncbi:hypothetical protein BGW42_008275 [Actinomortierella wolfii]|nr:hypothetical protein BGW42_008275 [Actinomortierella wolfii]
MAHSTSPSTNDCKTTTTSYSRLMRASLYDPEEDFDLYNSYQPYASSLADSRTGSPASLHIVTQNPFSYLPREADYEGVSGMSAGLHSATSSPYYPHSHPFDPSHRRDSNGGSVHQHAQRLSPVATPSDDLFVPLSYPVALSPTSPTSFHEQGIASDPSYPLNGLYHPPSTSPAEPSPLKRKTTSRTSKPQALQVPRSIVEPSSRAGRETPQSPTLSMRNGLLQGSTHPSRQTNVEDFSHDSTNDSPTPPTIISPGASNEELPSDSGFARLDVPESEDGGIIDNGDHGTSSNQTDDGVERRRPSEDSTMSTAAQSNSKESNNATTDNETVTTGMNTPMAAVVDSRKASHASGAGLNIFAKLTRRFSRHMPKATRSSEKLGDGCQQRGNDAIRACNETTTPSLVHPHTYLRTQHSQYSNPSPLILSTSGPDDYDYPTLIHQFPAYLFQGQPYLPPGAEATLDGVGLRRSTILTGDGFYYPNRQEEARRALAVERALLMGQRWKSWTLFVYSVIFTVTMVRAWIGDPAIKPVLDSGIMMIANRKLLYRKVVINNSDDYVFLGSRVLE